MYFHGARSLVLFGLWDLPCGGGDLACTGLARDRGANPTPVIGLVARSGSVCIVEKSRTKRSKSKEKGGSRAGRKDNLRSWRWVPQASRGRPSDRVEQLGGTGGIGIKQSHPSSGPGASPPLSGSLMPKRAT